MKNTPWIPFWMAVMLAAGVYIGVKVGQRIPHILGSDEAPSKVQNKLDEILRYVNARYMEDVNQDQLLGTTIDELLAKLDPHSSYITSDELQGVTESMEGDFEGVGIEYMMSEDTINVVSTIHGGPSEQAGVMAGDKLIMIEDSLVAGVKITGQKLLKKLRGPKGTQVHLAVKRGAQKIDFTVTRDEIPNRSVDAGFMLNEKTGYIKVNRFSEKTYKEFMEKLDPMVEKQGMKDLVIDLRGNPGGYLQKAVDILNQFFKERDKMLVYTKGLNSPKTEYKTNGKPFYQIEKISVLIDETSASASEIVAGALQDWDRATIIGRRSYGKGLVQEQYPLSDGSALRLTVAQYFIPSGRCIQKPYKNNKDYENDLELRIKNGELLDAEKNKSRDTSKYYTLGGKLVHGGGGITPDIFVPIEAFVYDEYFAKIKNHISQFALQYAAEHKAEFPTDENTFVKTPISDKILDAFINFTEKKGVAKDVKKLNDNKIQLRNFIKARIGKSLFNDETQYRIFIENDKMIERALNG